MSEPAPKTVEVRIAVAVDAAGNWNSCGYSGADIEDMFGLAAESMGGFERSFILKASLPIPTTPEVAAAVEGVEE